MKTLVRQDYGPLSRSVACSSSTAALGRRVRSEFDQADYNIRLLSNTLEPIQGENSLTPIQAGEYKGGDVTLSYAIGFLIFHDLWQRFESVRDLYRDTSNEHALDPLAFAPGFRETFLRYPIGQATVKDELVAAYHEFFELRGQASIDKRALRPTNPHYGGDFLDGHVSHFRDRVCSALSPQSTPPPPPPPPPVANNSPTAEAGPDQVVWPGALVMLDGSASSDPDDEPLRFRWNQFSGQSVVLSSQNIVNPTFTAPEGLTAEAVLRFRLLVTDPSGRFDSVTVTVDPEAEPPATIYYFPHLAVGAGWQTTITLINYSSEEVSCRTEFLSDDGTPLTVSFADRGTGTSRDDDLPPGGSVHQETNMALSAPAGLGAGRLHGAGEGQPAVSQIRQRRGARGGSRSECDDGSGQPLRQLCRTGRGSTGDRSGLCQSLRHGGPSYFYGPGRGWGGAG